MRSILLVSFLLGTMLDSSSGIASNKKQKTAQPAKESAVTEPQFTWNMSLVPDSSKLRISYTVKNLTPERIYICNKMVVAKGDNIFSRTDLVTTLNHTLAGSIKIVLGRVSPDDPVTRLVPPTFEPLEKGHSLDRTIETRWPLRAWHPDGGVAPLAPLASTVSFELHYFKGEPPTWRTLPSDELTDRKSVV